MMQTQTVPSGTLFEQVAALKDLGHRLVQVCSTKTADGMELTYSFDKNYEIIHLRTTWTAGESVPSIQAAYAYAFIYENEIAELFGVRFAGMTVDFSGQLYKTARPSPFGSAITIQEA